MERDTNENHNISPMKSEKIIIIIVIIALCGGKDFLRSYSLYISS